LATLCNFTDSGAIFVDSDVSVSNFKNGLEVPQNVLKGDSHQNKTSRSLRRKTWAQSILSEGKDVYYSGGVRK
jgi:hypothetical protein